MTPTPLFTGEAGTEIPKAKEIARRLAPAHRDLGYGLLFSAAAYLIRDGQAPAESRVLKEARRRLRMVHDAVKGNRERREATRKAATE